MKQAKNAPSRLIITAATFFIGLRFLYDVPLGLRSRTEKNISIDKYGA